MSQVQFQSTRTRFSPSSLGFPCPYHSSSSINHQRYFPLILVTWLRNGRFLTRTREFSLVPNLRTRSGSHPLSTAFTAVSGAADHSTLVPRLKMSGATPLLPHLPSWGAHGEPRHYMILHLRAPAENKTRTKRVDELQLRGVGT